MSITDIATSASASWGGMDSVSGASSYVPPATVSTATAITNSLVTQMRSDIKHNSQDFRALKTALNANDLAGANQAFTTLQKDMQKASSAANGASPFDPNGPIGKSFQAIGDALQSGDLTTAKQALASFKQGIRMAGHTTKAQQVQSANDTDDGGTSSSSMASNTSTVGNILNTTA